VITAVVRTTLLIVHNITQVWSPWKNCRERLRLRTAMTVWLPRKLKTPCQRHCTVLVIGYCCSLATRQDPSSKFGVHCAPSFQCVDLQRRSADSVVIATIVINYNYWIAVSRLIEIIAFSRANWSLQQTPPASVCISQQYALLIDRCKMQLRKDRRRYNWHGAGVLGWPFPVLEYKYIFQIKYTEAILSNSTRKPLWFEITKMLVAV